MAITGKDIFQRQVISGTPMSSDATRLILPDMGNDDLLVQNFSAQYQQNINRLWEVGSPKTYFIAGRTQGQMQIKRVIGGKGVAKSFVETYGNVCNMKSMSIKMSTGCEDTGGETSLKFEGAVITSVGYSVAAADMLINEDFSLLFVKLTY